MSGVSHKQRVKDELIKAGMTGYGLLKHEGRNVHKIIHDSEHIRAVVYGRAGVDSVILIATDRRVIYFDKKPYLSDEDEIPYDMVGGVTHGETGLFATITLHTRIGDYTIRFASPNCVRIFVKYIERRRLEASGNKW